MATRLLQAHHGQLNITALAAEIGVSERQLERLFHERLGVTPKHYARVVRLEHAISQLPHFGTQADVAAATGYADESHLLRDFRALSGVTPTQLIAERRL